MTDFATTIQKGEFDLFTTMLLMQQKPRVGEFFTDKYGDDFKKHFLLIKQNMLSQDAVDYAKTIFDEVIKTDDNNIELYNDLISKPKKVERYKNIKRRIPLAEIKETAKARGKMTENERAMIAGYELKNLVARIHNKGKLNMFTDEEARDVIATIETVKKKLAPILKNK